MPRYPLIIKHSTYVELYKIAGIQGKSLGKLINDILDEYVRKEAGGAPEQMVCIVCGKPAIKVGFGKGRQRLFVCSAHRPRISGLNGSKDL